MSSKGDRIALVLIFAPPAGITAGFLAHFFRELMVDRDDMSWPLFWWVALPVFLVASGLLWWVSGRESGGGSGGGGGLDCGQGGGCGCGGGD
ncbi:hypothetical protein [Streptomyces sp. NPDC059256]|uniref:hypothetical protein n=1 Tax=Streptomyces sp. NPDC059256 TaxID=3346794 RepID=UPI003675D7F3